MREGQPSYEQLYEVIGSIYADAYLRIKFLENENRLLREDQHKCAVSLASVRKELEELKSSGRIEKEWNNGSVNSMLPASLQDKFPSESTV